MKLSLRLQSDGTLLNTKLVDQDGRELDGVVGLTWSLDLNGQPVVSLSLVGVEVNIDHDNKVGGVPLGHQIEESTLYVKSD